MTIHTALNLALVANGSLPMDGACSCPCCNQDDLWRDDIASEEHFHKLTLGKMRERYGAPVCFACAESHVLCGKCDAPIADTEVTNIDYHSGETLCAACEFAGVAV